MKRSWNLFYTQFITYNGYKTVLNGLIATVEIAVLGLIIGILIGTLIALVKVMPKYKIMPRILNRVCDVYVGFFRGTPMVVQLLIGNFVLLPALGIPADGITVAIVIFGLNSGAYVSEMVRGGILAVDKGQTEAGRSLGLSSASTMVLIVLPQMFKIVLPSLLNEFITLLKETAVVGYIGLRDLTKAGDQVRGVTFSPYMPLLVVAAIYLLIVSLLTYVFNRIERKVRASDLR